MERRPSLPESNDNRIPPPEKGGSTFPVKIGPSRTPTETPGNKNIAPTTEEIDAANNGAYAGSTETVKKVGGNRVLKAVLGVGTVIGTGAIVYEAVPAVHQVVDSAFLNHLKGKSLQPISSTQAEAPTTEINNNNHNSSINKSKEEVFDPTATKGVINEENTVKMTWEEYEKIAPPLIDRENRKGITGEIILPPEAVAAGGEKTRKLTLEQNTSVTALIYVKTPEGKVRDLTYAKITNPGKIRQTDFIFPGCQVLLGLKGEIQQGDKMPAPISGRAYTHGLSPSGTGSYYIENEYRDPETGKLFKVTATISSGRAKTKPLVENMPELDLINGTFSWRDGVKKMPIVTIREGEDFFEYTSEPDLRNITMLKSIKSQTVVVLSYEGDIGENGIGNIFAGQNCTHPTLDNKTIVLE